MGTFEVRGRDVMPTDESAAAKRYWGGLGVQASYAKHEHWNERVAREVLEFNPRTVLELGCNLGRNLLAISRARPELSLVGVDVNAEAIAEGRARSGLQLFHSDETFLSKQVAGAFDVAFTVSVLDHTADPEPVLAELLRVTRLGVVLLEPWIGSSGKVVRSPVADGTASVDSTPFSYSWDYDEMLQRRAPRCDVSKQPYPLTDAPGPSLGAHYYLWRVSHRAVTRWVRTWRHGRPRLPE